MWNPFGRREPQPTREELFIQRTFGDAIVFCEEAWIGYERHFVHVLPDFLERYPLSARLAGFVNGPIYSDLETAFPGIGEMAADMLAKTGDTNGRQAILGTILVEALVRAGVSRAALRKAMD